MGVGLLGRHVATAGRPVIDISVPIDAHTHVFPGDPAPILEVLSAANGVTAVSRISISTHIGTHIDAPAHLIAGMTTTERIPLAQLCGHCVVADLSVSVHLGEPITAQHLRGLKLAKGCERLLIRTANSEADVWAGPQFASNFTALAPDAAWVLALPPPLGLGLKLVGIDYLSVDPLWAHELPAHRALLGNNVVVLEGLDLRGVRAGSYELICLPLKLIGSDGAPTRAILRLLEASWVSSLVWRRQSVLGRRISWRGSPVEQLGLIARSGICSSSAWRC